MNTQTQNNDHPNLNNPQTMDCADATPPRPSSLRVPVRVGKIARLLPSIRDELNQRIENGETADTLLPWINGLRETKELLRKQFSNQAINKQNLSDWRHGGFAEWQLRQQLHDDAREMSLHAGDLEERPCQSMADNLVTAFTARYASFLLRWDGEATPQIEARVKLYSRLRRDLTALQQSSHLAAQRSEERDQLEEKKDRQLDAEVRREELMPIFVALNRAMAGNNPLQKLAADIRNALQYDTPFPFPDDLLPDDEKTHGEVGRVTPCAPPSASQARSSQPKPAPTHQPSTPQPSTNTRQAPSSQLSSTPVTPKPSESQNPPNPEIPVEKAK